jgi:hypothetical protein
MSTTRFIRQARLHRSLTGRLTVQVLVEETVSHWNPHTDGQIGYTDRTRWRDATPRQLPHIRGELADLPLVDSPLRRPLFRAAGALGGFLTGLAVVGGGGAALTSLLVAEAPAFGADLLLTAITSPQALGVAIAAAIGAATFAVPRPSRARGR